ncbi:MAG: hypothetical protein Q9180_008863, partial [Flavoplaca navasiana]
EAFDLFEKTAGLRYLAISLGGMPNRLENTLLGLEESTSAFPTTSKLVMTVSFSEHESLAVDCPNPRAARTKADVRSRKV